MNVDPRDVLVFHAVVEAGSFSAAARTLGVAKSAVSRQVQRLEHALDARLLQRTTRQVRLTDAGRAFQSHAIHVFEALRDGERSILEMQDEPQGVLRITAPVEAESLLGDALVRFLAAHPKLRLETEFTSRIVDLVGEGFDLAVRGGAPGGSSLIGKQLGPSQRVLVASPAYLDAHGTPEEPEDVRRHAALVYRPWRSFRFDGPNGPMVIAPDSIRFLADHQQLLARAALGGLGIAQTVYAYVSEGLREGSLVRLLQAYEKEGQSLWIVYPSRRLVTPAVRAFIDQVGPVLAAGNVS